MTAQLTAHMLLLSAAHGLPQAGGGPVEEGSPLGEKLLLGPLGQSAGPGRAGAPLHLLLRGRDGDFPGPSAGNTALWTLTDSRSGLWS